MIFANKVAADIWRETWCDRCFQPDQVSQRLTGRGRGCKVLYRAMVNKTVPKELTPGRDGLMQSAFKCSEFAAKPASVRPAAKVEAGGQGGGR